ncbi:MAG: curli-like amyloid fiber formation chaperone CsgH [Pseudomonadota bacterium]
MRLSMFFLCLLSGLATAAESSSLEAWIDVEDTGETLLIEPKARAAAAVGVRYRLHVTSVSGSNSNTTKQSGRASLTEEESALSTTRVGLSGNQRYEIQLLVDSDSGESITTEKHYPE